MLKHADYDYVDGRHFLSAFVVDCDIAIKAGWSWDVKIDNSTFKDNRIAINSGYLSEVTRSYFLNNTDAAAWNIYGGTFRNNAFVEK